MMNFPAGVPQPSQNAPGDVGTAFQDAVARAKEIAARLQPSETISQGLKRPYEDSSDQLFPGPDPKKIAAINDPIGAQLKAMSDQSVNAAQAQMQARTVADQINSKLLGQAMGGSQQMSQMAPQVPGLGRGLDMGNNGSAGMGGGAGTVTEEMQIPNKVVGLVIGKGGDMINRLQSDSGCRIQVAPDPMVPMPERSVTLSGTPQQVEIAKALVNQVVETGMTSTNHAMPNEGETYIEMMIPATKVGLIIGKGGETIKSLIERSRARMTMIQDGMYAHAHEKPLRIFGDPQSVQQGKKLVMDLIAERENDGYGGRGRGPPGGGGGGGFHIGEYGGGRGGQTVNQVEVPRDAVGHVIGRGGETIKSIQSETGAKVQFQPDEPGKPVRICTVSGAPDKVSTAVQRIDEIINEKIQRDGPGGGGGGGGRGGGGGGGYGGPRDSGEPVTQLAVPSDKCGLVIGKGGDTIRQINQMTGAHVELQRNTRPDAPQKYFGIRGTPQQVQAAIMKICEKAGINPPEPNAPNGMGPGGHPGPHGGPPMGGYGYGQPSSAQHPGNTSYPGHAPQGWGQAISHWEQPAQSPQASSDSNYYSQYYGGGASAGTPQAPANPTPTSAPAPAQQSSSEPDYTQQWADYYRMIGRPDYADVVLASRNNQPAVQGSQSGQTSAAASQAPAPYGQAQSSYGQQAPQGGYGQQPSYAYSGYGS